MPPESSKKRKPAGPVWARRTGGRAGQANVAYCAGWDVRARPAADLELLPWDLWTNRAHCTMLTRAGVIEPERLGAILDTLDKLEARARDGRFQLDPALEDVHLNVEHFVERHAGAQAAGVMHTARSRNDQVATDMRLYLRAKLLDFADGLLELNALLRRLARRTADWPMPGLTHHQPGAWTTLGHWCAAHAFAMHRDLEAITALLDQANCSPLGAAASFGSSWPIDRAFAASLLGFDAPQENSLDCVTNRSEFEARAAQALAAWAQHAATLCQDLILFSSPPWQLLRLGDDFVTGSSIMPQKRNPDFAEVTKAKAALAGATAATLLDLTRGDPSGYNREQQWAKYLVMELFDELGPAPAVLAGALDSMQPDRQRMRQLMAHDYLEAADLADYLAQTRRLPFRQTYRWLGEAVRRAEQQNQPLAEALAEVLRDQPDIEPLTPDEQNHLADPDWLIARRDSQGGPAPHRVREQCDLLAEREKQARRRLRALRRKTETARDRLEKAMRRYAGR